MTGEWLAHCAACPVPEIANVFNRAGINFHQVTGMLDDDPPCWEEVDDWLDAARVANVMDHNRLGLMGHYYGGMLDIYSDVTLQCATFGGHIEMLEVDELAALRRDVSEAEIDERVATFPRHVRRAAGLLAGELAARARTSVALDRLVERARSGIAGLLLHGHGQRGQRRRHQLHHPRQLSLLTARGIPVAGEYEVKNAQAMKILDALASADRSPNTTRWTSRTTWS